MTTRWHKAVLSAGSTLLEAIRVIDASALMIGLVTDPDGRLVGTVTDGDIRRGILNGVSLEEPVERIMHRSPIVAHPNEPREVVADLMKRNSIQHIPVVDDAGMLQGLLILQELLFPDRSDSWVVIMAGGKGRRLGSLTQDRPKPLLKVGEKPILETILENLRRHGLRQFFISVNYKGDMIRDYFGDGDRWGASIEYLQEDQSLGTAGSLSLLPGRPTQPLLVMNADLLTNINYAHLFAFHERTEAAATMCVRQYDFQVPYGVVSMRGDRLVGLDEKPTHTFFVNAGIYALSPEVLGFVPEGRAFQMTDLFHRLLDAGLPTSAFPITEYWLDVGRLEDFAQAQEDVSEVFRREGPHDEPEP